MFHMSFWIFLGLSAISLLFFYQLAALVLTNELIVIRSSSMLNDLLGFLARIPRLDTQALAKLGFLGSDFFDVDEMEDLSPEVIKHMF